MVVVRGLFLLLKGEELAGVIGDMCDYNMHYSGNTIVCFVLLLFIVWHMLMMLTKDKKPFFDRLG